MKRASLPQLKKKADLLFSTYIRLRDSNMPCISCSEMRKLQCGHYYAKSGYDGLRYNELNAHGECAKCNCFDASHLINYTENIIKRIGKQNFNKLKREAKKYKQTGHKWSRDELMNIIADLTLKIKQLKENL